MKISRRRGWVLLLLAGGMAGLVGCSSGGGTSGSSAPAVAAPEAQRTTPVAVAAGMRTIDQIGKGIATAAGTDKARAQSLAGQIEPAWQPIEGTVKQNDQNAYLAMEDAFAVLEKAAANGDGPAAAKGADSVSATVQGYLARYPG
ncbi:MAG: hypothetical protein ACRDSP_19225 [Pseudonocardiaceae bacterium]